jgi:hypothetical protein
VFLSEPSSTTVRSPLIVTWKLVAALRLPARFSTTAVTSCTPLASRGALNDHTPVLEWLFTRPTNSPSIETFTNWPGAAVPR